MFRCVFVRRVLQTAPLVLLLSLPALAVVPDQAGHGLDGPTIELPYIIQATSDRDFQEDVSLFYEPFLAFKKQYGPGWHLRMDRRTMRPAMIWGSGIPWMACGAKNASLGGAPDCLTDSLETVKAFLESKARSFIDENPGLFDLNMGGRTLSLEVAQIVGVVDDRVWTADFHVRLDGIPVHGAWITFRVNHGNLIQFGLRHISDALASVPSTPGQSLESARAAAAKHAGKVDLRTTQFFDEGTLLILPVTEDPRSWEGALGEGLSYKLAWRFSFRRKGELSTWVAYVDAVSGKILAFFDDNRYDCESPTDPQSRVTGGVYARTPADPEEVRAMPYVLVNHGGPVTTDYNGIFPQTVGVPSNTGLNGTYINMNCSSCSNPSQAYVEDPTGGDLMLGTGGNNTTGNGFSTPAERNTFYHLNVSRAMVRKHLDDADASGYLDRNTPANVNLGSTCNAFWDGNAVNFYMGGGGCNNTGEISDVVLHEWGHGLDQFTTPGGIQDGARSEGLADTNAVMASHSPNMAPYFFVGDPIGIRNVDEDDPNSIGHLDHDNLLSKCSGGSGPWGGEVHCEGLIFGEANWRLGLRLREKYGDIGGWYALERLFYGHMPLARTYIPDQTGSAYDAYIAVDDDDGNLNNGTPNADVINEVFDYHDIASTPMASDSPECTPPTAPVPTLEALSNADTGLFQVRVSFDGVAGATQYDILRNEDDPDGAAILVGTILPPFPPDPIEFLDDNVYEGRTYYYRIRMFDNAGCVSTNDTTVSVSVSDLMRIGFDSYVVDDSAGNLNGIVEPGETITLPLTIVNLGAAVTDAVGTLEASTLGVNMITDQADYGDMGAGDTVTSQAPHFSFSVASVSSLCGSVITFNLTVEAVEGCGYASFQVLIGELAGDDVFLFEDFETDTGWIVDPEGTDDATTGIWVREDPNPTNWAPGDDHTPTGTRCWVTGNINDPGNAGRDDVDDGCTTLQSAPGWDFTGEQGLMLSYWRWYVVETRLDDEFLVEISNDGGNSWRDLERVGSTSMPFVESSFDLEQVLGQPAEQVALRFTACDTGGGSLIEAAIDDLSIHAPIYVCEDATPRPRLALSGYEVDDGILQGQGNGDRIPDPNEDIVIQLTLKNIGNETALSVSGTLSLGAAPPGVTVEDDYATFADIPPSETRVSAGPTPMHYALHITSDEQYCGDEMEVEVSFEYTDGTELYSDTASFTLQIGVINEVNFFSDDFETADDNGWTHVEVAGQDDWQHDSPSGLNANDPPSAYSGSRVWGNDLANGNFDGDYQANVHNYLQSPTIDMQSAVDSRLRFQRWLTVEEGIYDQAILSVNGVEIWRNQDNGHTLDTEWTEQEYDISAIADGRPNVRVRFELSSDAGLQYGGWTLDDFQLFHREAVCHPYEGCVAPPPDPVGNLLRVWKNNMLVHLDWSTYSGNATMFNGYLAEGRPELPFAPASREWPSYDDTMLNDLMMPGEPPLLFYAIRAINDCLDEEE